MIFSTTIVFNVIYNIFFIFCEKNDDESIILKNFIEYIIINIYRIIYIFHIDSEAT